MHLALALLYCAYILAVSFKYQGGKMKKLIDFKDLVESIQKYADKNCEGNFNMAVRKLITKGLEKEKES